MGTLDACNGHPLRVERARHNLTQQQLAEAAKVGAITIWRAENGYLINAESRQRLCDYFGKSASELGLLGREKFASRKVPAPPQTTSLASVSLSVPAVRHSYEARPTSFSSAKALDLLLEAPNQVIGEHMGAWLALGASHLSVLFEAGWTLENILESLRVVMQGMQGLPAVTRRTLLELGSAAVVSGITLPTGRFLTEEERLQATESLGFSLANAWKLVPSMGNAQMFAIAQSLLSLLQQAYPILHSQLCHLHHTGAYNLLGITLHFQERYEESLHAYQSAYLAALALGDPWYISQNLICQANAYQELGKYNEAFQIVEEAFRIIGNPVDERLIRTRSHLFVCWANTAMTTGDYSSAQKYLEIAEGYVSQSMIAEEFNRTDWHLLSGQYALMTKNYSKAGDHFKKALDEIPSDWILRRAMNSIGLAKAYAHLGERDASLTIAKESTIFTSILDATLINRWFTEYIQQDLLGLFPKDPTVRDFLVDVRTRLPIGTIGEE